MLEQEGKKQVPERRCGCRTDERSSTVGFADESARSACAGIGLEKGKQLLQVIGRRLDVIIAKQNVCAAGLLNSDISLVADTWGRAQPDYRKRQWNETHDSRFNG